MEQIKMKQLSFSYSQASTLALEDITLTVQKGEFLTICGESGCGKTTLLRLLKPALSPKGMRSGELLLDGKPVSELSPREGVEKIGFVLQNPTHQIVCETVWQELAFGLENLGVPSHEIRTRVAEISSFFGIEGWFRQKTATLSGGQRQLLCLASAMLTNPELLLLDEPTAQLDPIAASEFLAALGKINRELGTTVILSEHRPEEAMGLSSRVLVLEEGRTLALGTPHEVAEVLKREHHPMQLALPAPLLLCGALTSNEGKAWLATQTVDASRIPPDETVEGDAVITVKDAWVSYDKEVLRGMNLTVKRGEIFALLGGNGAGKSTALSLVAGMIKPEHGNIRTDGKIWLLPQDVETLLGKNTVREELGERGDETAELCRISHLLDAHPYDCSGGEQQRIALAKVLLQNPQILLLDEPTKGMDAVFKREFAEILADLQANGVTVLLVSHDLEFAAAVATRCGLLFDGEILSVAPPREFFSGNRFYTTSANRMAKEVLPRAVTTEDILLACGKAVVPPPKTPPKPKSPAPNYREESRPNHSGWTMLSLVLAAVTLGVGLRFFGEKRFLLTGLLLAGIFTIPYFLVFERKRPPAREIVTLSVLCALAIAGRAVFFALPQVKPALAIVIVAGLSLGSESGCLVGALTALVSNFFFGQGIWTPWQMLAFALVGLFAGLLPRRIQKIPLCIFGFFGALLYGLVMNPASVVIAYETPAPNLFLAAFASGLPFDLVHAVATAGFLWFLGMPMREKLVRMRQKTIDTLV